MPVNEYGVERHIFYLYVNLESVFFITKNNNFLVVIVNMP